MNGHYLRQCNYYVQHIWLSQYFQKIQSVQEAVRGCAHTEGWEILEVSTLAPSCDYT